MAIGNVKLFRLRAHLIVVGGKRRQVSWGIICVWLLFSTAGCGGGERTVAISPTATTSASGPSADLASTLPTMLKATSSPVAPEVSAMTPSPPVRASATVTISRSSPAKATRLPTLPTSSPTPHPMAAYTIEGLRNREYLGGVLNIRALLAENDAFSRYYIDYPSDGLTITGIMQVPHGEGPFPVIIMNHGYIDQDQYWSGADTSQAAEYLNQRGYLTIAPDFRNWGESDSGLSFFHTGLVIDVINLISALPSVAQADWERLGMWGHSMGGGITTKVLTVDERIKAAVLYAPNSADDADILARWGPGCAPDQSETTHKCNPAEGITTDLPDSLWSAYLSAAVDPEILRQIAPIYHLDNVLAPAQIHIGTADGVGKSETPPSWSTDLYEGLEAAGKEATLYLYEGQGHFFAGQAWTLLMQRTADFFDTQLGVEALD